MQKILCSRGQTERLPGAARLLPGPAGSWL